MNMLRHVLGVARHDQRGRAPRRAYADGCLDAADLVIVGPGPGDPRDGDDAKIATLPAVPSTGCSSGGSRSSRSASATRCCATGSGSRLAYKDIVFQGTQAEVGLDGRPERVGFYNTFVGRVPDGAGRCRTASRSRPTRTPATSTWSRGPHFRGIQFHAESILTEHGSDLVHDLVSDLLAGEHPVVGPSSRACLRDIVTPAMAADALRLGPSFIPTGQKQESSRWV